MFVRDTKTTHRDADASELAADADWRLRLVCCHEDRGL